MAEYIILLELYGFFASAMYYGWRMITPSTTRQVNGYIDWLTEFGHLTCPLVMIPMAGVGLMGNHEILLLCSWFSWGMTCVFLAVWVVTRIARVLGVNFRSHTKWWWDLPHALMFYVMFLTYEQHLVPLTEGQRWQLWACGWACVYFTLRYVNNIRKDTQKYRGRKLFYELAADGAHVVMFGGSAGMALLPRYFMA